jgi:hypothetical protein
MAKRLDLVFEAGDLGVARVGDLACGTRLGKALLERVPQVGICAVEGRAGDPRAARASVLMSHRPAGGRSPRRSWSVAARMRASVCWRCWLVRDISVLRGRGGIDLLEHAQAAGVFLAGRGRRGTWRRWQTKAMVIS